MRVQTQIFCTFSLLNRSLEFQLRIEMKEAHIRFKIKDRANIHSFCSLLSTPLIEDNGGRHLDRRSPLFPLSFAEVTNFSVSFIAFKPRMKHYFIYTIYIERERNR